MSLWEERAARNEALFREVNEQMRTLAGRFSEGGVDPEFVCECSDEACTLHVSVSLEAYESVRAHPRRFIVVPGHEGQFEHVVRRTHAYLVVEKDGTAGRISERNDPRAD